MADVVVLVIMCRCKRAPRFGMSEHIQRSIVTYTFDARIRKSCFSFRGRLQASTNVIIHALNNNFWITNNYMWYKWKTLLITVLINVIIYSVIFV